MGEPKSILRSAGGAVLCVGLLASACFEAPDYIGKTCGVAGDCPLGLICGRNGVCTATVDEDAGFEPSREDAGLFAQRDAGTAMDGGGPPSSPPDGGVQSSKCSKRSTTMAKVVFVNHCSRTITPVWVDFDCAPDSREPIPAGAERSQSTFLTHVWALRDTSSGALVRDVVEVTETELRVVACRELLHRWSFDDGARDSVGAAHGKLMNGARTVNGALRLDGVDDFVDLPIQLTMAGLESMTIETWFSWSGPETQPWNRVFDFGFGTTRYMFLTPRSGAGVLRFASTLQGTAGEQIVDGRGYVPLNTIVHVAVTIDAQTQKHALYFEGALAGTRAGATVTAAQLGATPSNWLGRSHFAADGFFLGQIHELRIYRDALSSDEVRLGFMLGPDRLPPR